MSGTGGDPRAYPGRDLPSWPPLVVPLLWLYALVQIVDGFSIGIPAGFGAALLRGPWLAARVLPFLFLLTLNRRGARPLALATGLAAGQIFCSAYVDTLTRGLLNAPGRFVTAETLVSCSVPIVIAFLFWRREGAIAGGLRNFVLRGCVAASVLIGLSFGPIATVALAVMILAPLGLRWR